MSFCMLLKAFMAMLMGICFLMIGCGKKPETDAPELVPTRPPITEIDQYLSKQNVACESQQACPSYLAKIVVVDGGKYRFCTGFLTDKNVVATSTSCLPSLLQLNNQLCSQDVFFFFPQAGSRPAKRVNCERVLQVSHLEGQDPILWRDDVSFLKLAEDLPYRRKARISRLGALDGKNYSAWMVDQQDEHSAIIKKSVCEAVHNNYVNPLVQNESSPNMLFAGCSLSRGSTGGPIMDNSGRIRGMVSQKMDPKLRTYLESTGLLVQGLKEMFHGTNFACAPTLDDNDMLNEAECLRGLSYTRVDKLRSDMLSTSLLFGDLRTRFEESLTNLSDHVEFGVKMIPRGDIQETVIFPRCFKPLRGWLATFGNRNTYVGQVKIPVKSFRRTMDTYGRIKGITLESPEREFFIQYSLKNLRSSKKSSILMWIGNEDLQTYSNISEECGGSLL